MNYVPEKLTPSRNLKQCSICARRFTSDRIKVHETICQKSSGVVRKSFDVSQQRIRGTEAEKFLKSLVKIETDNKNEKNSLALTTNWRWKHEDVIKRIKDDKKRMMEMNQKINDLSLAQPLEFEDAIQCPNCSRQSHKSSTEQHICMCATMVSRYQNQNQKIIN